MFQGIFKSVIKKPDTNTNYIFGTGSIPIQIKTAQLETFANSSNKQQGYEVAEVNKLISTMLTGWDANGNKPKSMSDNYLELILSCDNGFVVKKRLQFPHIIAWQDDSTQYNIADVYKEFSVDNWLKADDFENPDITLVVEPTDEILTTSTATPPEATTEQSGRFYLYYRNLPVGVNRIHIDFHIKTKTEPIDFDLEVIDGMSWKDAQTILASNEQAKINVLLSTVKDVYKFTGAEGNFEEITMHEWSALYQQIISLKPNNKFTHDLYFYIYDESELNMKITELIIGSPEIELDLQSFEKRPYIPYQGKWQLSGAKHIVVEVKKGEKYTVVGTTSVTSQYALLKSYSIPSSNNPVDYCDGFYNLKEIGYGATKIIEIPDDCRYMVFRVDAKRMPISCVKVGSKGVISNLAESSLKDKTIVLFGDSLTELQGEDGFRYSDWLQSLYGANVINCGIGGTQIRQRAKKTRVFSTLESYQKGDWVFRKDGDTYKWYEFTQDHSGEWNDADVTIKTNNSYAYANFDIINMIKSAVSGDFTEMDAAAEYTKTSGVSAISNLKLIDWSKVDIVTIFAGTNDWGDNLGVSGSEDVMTTLGAVNVLIKELLTAYPHIKLMWFTPVVRWIDIDGDGQFNPQGFSDVYTKGGHTLSEWVGCIKNEVMLNHIPICDMYNTLGWNKYNFWEYFTRIDKGDRLNDGTHPRKGFKRIAERFNAFIISNL